MKRGDRPMSVAPFPSEYRASGLLLHVTSLPSPYGIGDMGPAALEWIDRVHEAGQSWWQSLPLGPTGYGNSPYQALSSCWQRIVNQSKAFAGRRLALSRRLRRSILFTRRCRLWRSNSVQASTARQDMGKISCRRTGAPWFGLREVLPYASALAGRLCPLSRLKREVPRCFGVSYLDWPAVSIRRNGAALARAQKQLSKQIDKIRLAQFLIFQQAQQLKEYAHSKRVRLVGDLPFFVSPDSSDVWAHPELFLLDKDRKPRFVAGVPPDYFSADGQLWGNPVYD